jgi:hypothetical protein
MVIYSNNNNNPGCFPRCSLGLTPSEDMFAEQMCDGNKRTAMRALRVPENQFQQIDWTTLGIGMSIGVFFVRYCMLSACSQAISFCVDFLCSFFFLSTCFDDDHFRVIFVAI